MQLVNRSISMIFDFIIVLTAEAIKCSVMKTLALNQSHQQRSKTTFMFSKWHYLQQSHVCPGFPCRAFLSSSEWPASDDTPYNVGQNNEEQKWPGTMVSHKWHVYLSREEQRERDTVQRQNIRYACNHVIVKNNVHCVQSASRDSVTTSHDSINKRESQNVTKT